MSELLEHYIGSDGTVIGSAPFGSISPPEADFHVLLSGSNLDDYFDVVEDAFPVDGVEYFEKRYVFPTDLNKAKALAHAHIERYYDAINASGYRYNGALYGTDPNSRQLILGHYTRLLDKIRGGVTGTTGWEDVAGNLNVFTYQEFVTFAENLADWIAGNIQQKRADDQQIAGCMDVDCVKMFIKARN